ncbi:hypothetical protein LCGC14_0371420 [marine sediment metagenome]|uniref:Uncharacterized protein n=1 Tax=marine sediment metagenome TaxID=412755 RepID=A0A0F9T538_9ZZZZ|nr:hypothetical protein [bacterium]
MVKEIRIGDKVYTFKENMMGLDLLATFEEGCPEWKALKATGGLIARASVNPKLSNKDVFMMPYGEFIQMIRKFSDLYGAPGEFDFLEKE